ncbi:MAG: pilus assembly protein PilP [Pseudomonadota bacterium]
MKWVVLIPDATGVADRMARCREVTVAILAAMLLVGCAGGDPNADIKAFMSEVQSRPTGQIAPLPEFEPYQPYAYSASDKRSPFEPPIVIPEQTDEQKRNIGVRPPRDHVRQYLERFNLAALSMVGTMQQNNETWALIEDGDGKVTRVQVGDFMGTNWGKVESINETRIDITEIVSDGGDGWLRRPRTLELTGGAE